MITRALCTLRRKSGYPYQCEHEMYDSHGLAVGNEYLLNLDGDKTEWTITKIILPRPFKDDQ